MRPTGKIIAMGMLTSLFAFFGCSTKLVGGEVAADDRCLPGLRYYLPKDMVIVTGEVTRRAVRGVFDDPNSIQFGGFEKVATGQVELKPIADQSRTFLLHMYPGGTADNTLDVTLKPSGLPGKINLTSTDKSGEIVANSVKFAARIAATAAGVPPLPAFNASAPTTLRDLLKSIEGAETLRGLHARWSDADKKYDLAIADVRTAEAAIATAASDDEEKKATEALKRAEASAKRYSDLRREARTELMTEYEAFKARQRVGAVEDKRTFSYAIDIADAKSLGAAGLPSLRSVSDVASKVEKLPSLKRMWEEVGVLVTAVPAGGSPVDPVNPRYTARQEGTTKTPIYYRTPRPMLVSVWVKDVLLEESGANPGDKAVEKTPIVRLASETVMDVRDAADGPNFVAFDEKAFSTQNVEIGFDDRGNLVTFKRTGTSDLAALTRALADAAEAGPDQFKAGVTALGGVASERDKQAAAIAAQRKAALDAEVAQLEAEMKLLEARKKHKKAIEDARADGASPPPTPPSPGS